MKRYLLLIIFFFSVTVIYGQVIDVDSYYKNHSFFQKLDNMFLNYYAKENAIKTVQEIRYTVDSNGKKVDSSLLYYYSFDELGQLTEKRWNFTKHDSLYASLMYKYSDNNQKIDTVYYSPYSIDGVYDKRSLPAARESCVTTDQKGRKTVVNTRFFNKNNSFEIEFLIDYTGQDLIGFITVIDNSKEYWHYIKYEHYKRHYYKG